MSIEYSSESPRRGRSIGDSLLSTQYPVAEIRPVDIRPAEAEFPEIINSGEPESWKLEIENQLFEKFWAGIGILEF